MWYINSINLLKLLHFLIWYFGKLLFHNEIM